MFHVKHVYGGYVKINLVIYGEAVYLWGGGWVRNLYFLQTVSQWMEIGMVEKKIA